MTHEYHQLITSSVVDAANFIRATFTGAREGSRWNKATLRPVNIKGERLIQCVTFDEKQSFTDNHSPAQIPGKLRELLDSGFRSVFISTREGDIQVQIKTNGKAIIRRHKPAERDEPADLEHDRQKQRILSPESSDAYLKAVGIMTEDGRIKAEMQGKFKQINEFLKLVQHTGGFDNLGDHPIRAVDFGCGSAALTFATYHYLRHIVGVETQLTGVDIKDSLMERLNQKANSLGWDGLKFEAGTILEYQAETAPDMVMALHACDTATDDALAQAISWNSRLIFSAPCCHHHLQAQLGKAESPAPFAPVTEHGILKERVGDILTDSLRALILEIMGYRTDVIEFVSTEHTSKNLMIRATLVRQPGNAQAIAEYRALKAFWGVTPYLETLLGDSFPA